MVTVMRLYTKTGDDGTTQLFGAERTAKDDVRIEACGALDELNAALGWARAQDPPAHFHELLGAIQADLLRMGAELALATERPAPLGVERIGEADVTRLEEAIDGSEAEVPPLRSFILPGGTPAAAALHQARAICRRAERRVVAARAKARVRPEVIAYLNRVSDLLFSLARQANARAGIGDEPWRPRTLDRNGSG
jgi:cob(I)alamin adenosyltransferase